MKHRALPLALCAAALLAGLFVSSPAEEKAPKSTKTLLDWKPDPARTADIFLVPNNYVGWVHVEYGVKGAPTLPLQKMGRIYQVPRNGKLRTSSPLLHGWAKDRYFYVTSKGRKELSASVNGGSGMIWAGVTGNGEYTVSDTSGKSRKIQTPPTLNFFVGTWKQYSRDTDGPPNSKEAQAVLDGI